MRQANPVWKVAMAVLSLLLTVLIWQKGLQESFNRPSVAPKLSLKQQEISFLARPAIPQNLQSILVGIDPRQVLRDALRDIPLEKMDDRQKLILAGLEESNKDRRSVLNAELDDKSLLPVKEILLGNSIEKKQLDATLYQLEDMHLDPLLLQLSCEAAGGDEELCIDSEISSKMAMRLIVSQGLPVFATLLGSGLLVWQVGVFVRKRNSPWPVLPRLPLSLIDMVLLVAGGFVVLGEVAFPLIIAPFSSFFTAGIASPTADSLRVLIGYVAMALPPLVILRSQLNALGSSDRPEGGWLQFRLNPIDNAISTAFKGWLMVLPVVLLTGWIMNYLVGDQGGSNPLLELVLKSHNPLALGLLLLTTVVLAPLFEEVVFRGALLPVLARELGSLSGVIVSALVFALAHLSVGELPPLFVLGTGLALLRLTSGRLFPCVLMHALWNGVTFTSLLLLGA